MPAESKAAAARAPAARCKLLLGLLLVPGGASGEAAARHAGAPDVHVTQLRGQLFHSAGGSARPGAAGADRRGRWGWSAPTAAAQPPPGRSPLGGGPRRPGAGMVPGEVAVFRTALRTGERLSPLPALQWRLERDPRPVAAGMRLEVRSEEWHQKLLGFGGAFTEASVESWRGLDAHARAEAARLHFAPPERGGNGYTLGRVHVRSSDFETAGGPDEQAGPRDVVRYVQAAVGEASLAARSRAAAGGPVRMVAVPPSPVAPAGQGARGDPSGEQAEALREWSLDISRAVSAYKAQGVPVWGVLAPSGADPGEGASARSAGNASHWIRDHLGPVLRSWQPGLAILASDRSRGGALDWARELSGAGAAPFIDGLAVRAADGNHLRSLREAAQLGGEHKWVIGWGPRVCGGTSRGDRRDSLDRRWAQAEALAHDLLGDLAAGAHGWVDGGLLAGPGSQLPESACDASIVADAGRGLGRESHLLIQPSYYYVGHVSRFAPPGSVVVGLTQGFIAARLESLAFEYLADPTDPATMYVSVVVLNRGEDEARVLIADSVSGAETLPMEIPARSMTTFWYSRAAGTRAGGGGAAAAETTGLWDAATGPQQPGIAGRRLAHMLLAGLPLLGLLALALWSVGRRRYALLPADGALPAASPQPLFPGGGGDLEARASDL